MHAQLAKFLDALSLRTMSEDTRRTRKSHLGEFVRWCEARGLTLPTQLTGDVIQEFLVERRAAGLEQNTIAVKAGSIRAFLKWLEFHGRIQRAPHVEKPPVKFPLAHVLTPAQIDSMLKQCDDGMPIGYRDRALIEFLYGSAARIGEAWHLDVPHLDLPAATARVLGKGGETRLVLLTRSAVEALRTYIAHYRFPNKGRYHSDAVFISQRGNRCARNVLYEAIRRRADLAGIEVRVHPHIFRHSAATHLFEGGADSRVVQELLGHKSIVSTQRYTQLTLNRLRGDLERCHPREQPPPDPTR